MKDLTKMFKPESVAVIGASNTPEKLDTLLLIILSMMDLKAKYIQ